MPLTASPLRYPGGKTSLLDVTRKILKENKLQLGHYAEPYAGGCGLALSLLFGGFVSDIHINDIDDAIWCFWTSVLDYTDDFIELVEHNPVNMDEWHRQREILLESDTSSPLDLGFAAFFLNRTNRSGIIEKAGVIGGQAQNGNYKMDCRFNREKLVRRIRRISRYKNQIHLYHKDALRFIKLKRAFPENTFFCIDPPYYNKGSSLYTSFYQPEDHKAVSEAILKMPNPWIVTYDNDTAIRSLYKSRRQYTFDINYTLQVKRVGTELLIASKGLRMPQEIRERQTHRIQYRKAS
jgi:DNA adenine methylase